MPILICCLAKSLFHRFPEFHLFRKIAISAPPGKLGAYRLIYEDTLKELIGQRIAESDLPQQEKSTLLEQVRSLPGETIKHLTMKLVDAGLANCSAGH